MRKLLIFVIFCSMCVVLSRCVKASEKGCNESSPDRVGAICKDGTRAYTTDPGTCSDHGGVDRWICQ
ncbi:MAG: DUF3761 domain-containing protein [Bacteroidales bacterium]|nr:DUF3761 domain-containing protein [Bacteroidales bacterium]